MTPPHTASIVSQPIPTSHLPQGRKRDKKMMEKQKAELEAWCEDSSDEDEDESTDTDSDAGSDGSVDELVQRLGGV